MTTVIAPVELPTARRSYISDEPTQDIHDPNWIPVLSSLDYKRPSAGTSAGTASSGVEKEVSPYNTASFSPFPTRPPSPKRRAGPSHHYSKSSLAPESVHSSDVETPTNTLPPRTSSIANHKKPLKSSSVKKVSSPHLRDTSVAVSSSDGQETTNSDPAGDMSSNPSTIGTASLLDEANAAQAEAILFKPEAILSPYSHSARSSVASTRTRGSIPTSKYNRKPLPSNASANANVPPLPTTSPLPEFPTSTPTQNNSGFFTPPLTQALPSPKLPPEPTPQPESAPKLQAMKSTASERRQRALHSHPSNLSLNSRSRRNSSSSEAEIKPKQSSVKHKPRKSTDSRSIGNNGSTTPRSTIFDFQNPNPAPTTPLPELPPEARRPPTRDGQSVKSPLLPPPEAHLPAPKPAVSANEHTEMAAFMANTRTVVFRRFDDVHVRLLLNLQDEITQLEKDLLTVEGEQYSASEKVTLRTKILRDLRRVVAEYDHLFANWSQMQANKASQETMRDLKQWLEKPATSDGTSTGKGAKEDLQWLEKSKDLSSVNLGGKDTTSAPVERKESTSESTKATGGGFASLFACASKRK